MAWVDNLAGEVVALDTAPLIYFIEEHPVYLPIIEPFFRSLDAGRLLVITSTLTLLEVLVQPLRKSDQALADLYGAILLDAAGMTVLPVSASIARRAAEIRATRSITAPDAIQIATALEGGATVPVTNDLRLRPLPGLQIIALERLVGHRSSLTNTSRQARSPRAVLRNRSRCKQVH